MRYAEVSVNSPIARRRTFSYAIPSGLNIDIGHAVWVPFGERVLQGIVLELSPFPAVEDTREILGIIETRPILSPEQIALARWISEYYLSPLFDAVALMLPPSFERNVITMLRPSDEKCIMSTLNEEQQTAFGLAREKGKVSLREFEKELGKKKAQRIISQLVKRKLLIRDYELEPVKVKAKKETYISLALTPDKVRETISGLHEKRATKQAWIIEFLSQQHQPVPLSIARKNSNCSQSIIRSLADKRLVRLEQIEVKRDPISYEGIVPSSPLKLSKAQELAYKSIQETMRSSKDDSTAFLLHGVTGSGKTEIYLQALATAVKQGKRGIVLVPEIALTPQTIERFAARFPHRVAVLHSRLSLGEQFDEWHRIRNGEFDVVIGSRSAIFAPQPELGLIVIDEEHEWTYKQHDTSPRYHARSVAAKLAELTGATVILGSATPDVGIFYRAQKGDYRLLQLPERVVPSEGSPLPEVEIVDMREELKAGNRSIFSRKLSQAITKATVSREQVILFLNRRGAATLIQCRHCGFILRCRRCDTALTYHTADNVLTCHQCNHRMPAPQTCPSCSQRQLKFLGIGTQKLEQESNLSFPKAKQLRWDSDVTRGKDSHEIILSRFRNHEADILIGTQMIAKGLDFPLVTLVGVVSADTALNLPDFRAGERTFQLLSQVAGRAGRGGIAGKVIIQTYSPEHYTIQAAAKHDYAVFYNQEIAYRQQLRNPPFTQLASLVYTHTSEALCRREAKRMKDLILAEKDSRGIASLDIIGPAPAFIQRRRGKFRWQLILRGYHLSAFLDQIPLPQGWTADIDPISLI
ncbi:primosomal protein N' [Chloroflexota bacterium]